MPKADRQKLPQTLLLLAESNKHHLLRLLQLSDSDYLAHEPIATPTKDKESSWAALGYTAQDIALLEIKPGVIQTVSGLRTLCKRFEFLRLDGPFIKALLQGSGSCIFCHKSNACGGFLQLRADRLTQHERSQGHIK